MGLRPVLVGLFCRMRGGDLGYVLGARVGDPLYVEECGSETHTTTRYVTKIDKDSVRAGQVMDFCPQSPDTYI